MQHIDINVELLMRIRSDDDSQGIKRLIRKMKADGYDFYGENHYLNLAISRNRFNIVRMLIDSGASVEGRSYPSPLRVAIGSGCVSIAKFLIKKGAPVHTMENRGSFLDLAIYANSISVARLLIENGVEPKERNLYSACEKNNYDLAVLLIEAGVDVNGCSSGYTSVHFPLNYALGKAKNAQHIYTLKRHKLVSLLIQRGSINRTWRRLDQLENFMPYIERQCAIDAYRAFLRLRVFKALLPIHVIELMVDGSDAMAVASLDELGRTRLAMASRDLKSKATTYPKFIEYLCKIYYNFYFYFILRMKRTIEDAFSKPSASTADPLPSFEHFAAPASSLEAATAVFVAEQPPLSREEKCRKGLDADQLRALDAIVARRNVFVTGPGGCGKTFLYSRAKDVEDRPYAITAPTGCAAVNIGGVTLHKQFGVLVQHESVVRKYRRALAKAASQEERNELIRGAKEELWKHVRAINGGDVVRELAELEILFIDEISMVSAELFETCDYIARKARKTMTVPFGGIQVVVGGDYAQLKPVKAERAFKSDLWNEMNFETIEMHGNHRHSDDVAFGNMLLEIRRGKVTPEICRSLSSRVKAKLPEGIIPTRLFSRNDIVDQWNERELAKIELNPKIINGRFIWKRGVPDDESPFGVKWVIEDIDELSRTQRNIREAIMERTKNEMITPLRLVLKVGALVMLTYNIDVERGLANGTTGIVEAYDGPYPVVKFAAKGKFVTVPLTPQVWNHDVKPKMLRLEFTQIPLTLAWAITIHKSQGLTLSYVHTAINENLFDDGMAYVVLSRARSLDTITLDEFDPDAICASREVLNFHASHGLFQ